MGEAIDEQGIGQADDTGGVAFVRLILALTEARAQEDVIPEARRFVRAQMQGFFDLLARYKTYPVEERLYQAAYKCAELEISRGAEPFVSVMGETVFGAAIKFLTLYNSDERSANEELLRNGFEQRQARLKSMGIDAFVEAEVSRKLFGGIFPSITRINEALAATPENPRDRKAALKEYYEKFPHLSFEEAWEERLAQLRLIDREKINTLTDETFRTLTFSDACEALSTFIKLVHLEKIGSTVREAAELVEASAVFLLYSDDSVKTLPEPLAQGLERLWNGDIQLIASAAARALTETRAPIVERFDEIVEGTRKNVLDAAGARDREVKQQRLYGYKPVGIFSDAEKEFGGRYGSVDRSNVGRRGHKYGSQPGNG